MTLRALVQRYFDLINGEEWSELGELFIPYGTYTTMGRPPFRGREQVVGCFTSLFRSWETHVDTPRGFIFDDDAAAVKVRFTGRSTGGRDVTFDAVDIFTFEDDLIAELTTWYDRQSLAEALGAPSA